MRNELAKENPSLLKKIIKAIKNFIAELKDLMGSLPWAEAKALQDDVQSLDAIRMLFNQALNNTNKNTAREDGGVKYSRQITQDDIRNIQSVGRKSINDFSSDEIKFAEKWAKKFWSELGTKSPFFRAWFGDWRVNDTSPVKVVKISNKEYSENRRYVDCKDFSNNATGASVRIDENVIKDSLHYARLNGDLNATKKLLAHIDDVIQEAIYLDTQVSQKNKGNKKGTTTFMHYLYCPVEYNGAPFIAKITVEEYDIGGKRRAYNAQRIKMSSLPRAHFSQLNNEAKTRKIRLQDDEIMISDLFALVKQYDKNFNPNPVSKIVNEDGYPMVVYHGTKDDFTVFDRSKSRKKVHLNVLGDGNYFTANKDGAVRYGHNIIEAYVKINNPYVFKNDEYNTVADQIAEDFSIDRNSIKGSQVQAFLKKKGL